MNEIDSIVFATTMCFGTCPVLKMSINKDRFAVFNAIRFNKVQGDFTGRLDQKNYNELIQLLNYIDFVNLKEDYSVGWTDDQTAYLTISYDNGKKKKIKDYGLVGTFGLGRLYQLLFNLRGNQIWK